MKHKFLIKKNIELKRKRKRPLIKDGQAKKNEVKF